MTADAPVCGEVSGPPALRALRIRNFRVMWLGLGVSQCGRHVATVGQSLFVYELTDSAVALGVLTALQFLPILLLGAWTGAFVDRHDKRRVLCRIEVVAALNAFALTAVALLDTPPLAAIYLLALVSGTCSAFEDPARRSLPIELVPGKLIQNAVSLTTGLNTIASMTGPALAAILASTVGYAWCFLIDGLSYLVVVAAISRIDQSGSSGPAPLQNRTGQIREGVRHVVRSRELLMPLVAMMFVGALAVNHQVTLPVLIDAEFGRSSGTFALLMTTMSVGSFLGALVMAGRRSSVTARYVCASALAMGVAMALLAVNPWFPAALLFAALIGFTTSRFVTSCTTILQMRSAPEMRGRVLSLQMVSYLGVTPIGGPIVGVVTDRLGSRAGIGLGAVGCLAATVWAAGFLVRDGGVRAGAATAALRRR